MKEDFNPPGRGDFARPYHVTTGMPDWFFYASFVLVMIVSLMVLRAIRKDKKSGLTQSEREASALANLLGLKEGQKKPQENK